MNKILSNRYIPIVLLLLALALRFYGLETQSMWADEGGTLALAARTPDVILRDTLADVHPPLYYWILHAWMGLFGVNVAAARGLSAICGTLAVLATYQLARRWYGLLAGWVAGIAAAISPLAIHYSQEARMYALAMLLAALLFLVLDAWLDSMQRSKGPVLNRISGVGFSQIVAYSPLHNPSPTSMGHSPSPQSGRGEQGVREERLRVANFQFALYLLLAAALLMTHYFAVTIVAGAALLGIIRIAKQQRYRASLLFAFAHLPLAALYLAVVLSSRTRLSTWTAAKSPTDPLFVLIDTLRTFSIGMSGPEYWVWWALLFTGLVLAGFFVRASGSGRLTTGIWLGIPIVLMILISLGQPYYKPRFLLPALPAFHILVGAGVAGLGNWVRVRRQESGTQGRDAPLERLAQGQSANTLSRRVAQRNFLPWLGIALLLTSASLPLYREWFDPSVWRDDYRGAALAISATAGANDVLILNGQSQIDTLNVYLSNTQPRILLPRFRPLDQPATETELQQLAAQYRRIYGLFYVIEESDPQGIMANWLDTHAFPSGSRWYGDIQLRTWETGDLSDQMRSVDANIGGLHLRQQSIVPVTLTPGDAIRMQMDWQADSAPEQPLSLFIHLRDSQGQLIAQYDGPLALQPLVAGTTWTSHAAIILPPATPAGRYQILLGVYNPASGKRLNLADGADTLELGIVEVNH